MKLNSAGGLLQINVGSHHGPPPHGLGGGHNGGHSWPYMMPQTPDGVPVTSSSGLSDESLDVKLSSLHTDLPPDLTELKSLYPAEYPLTTNDPHLPQMGVVPPVRTFNTNGGPGGGGGGNGGSGGGGGGGGGAGGAGNENNGGASAVFDLVTSSTQMTPMLTPSNLKSELADYILNSDIDDIAALIGSAIADSTVPTLGGSMDECGGVTSSTIDPWTELDAWIESACVMQSVHSSSNNNNNNNQKLDQDNTIHTSEFHPTLQNLLQNDIIGQPQQPMFHDQTKAQEHFSTSILQSRLQQPSMRQENGNNNRHLSSPQHQLPESTTSLYGLKVDPYTLDPDSPPFDNTNGLGNNSEIQRPHTTHVSPPAVVTSTMGRYRKPFNQRKNYDGFMNGPGGYQGDFTQPGNVSSKLSNGMKKRSSKASKLNSSASACQSLDMVDNGKEKPIHRCGICNRGFLNKSNIKVHLRTHTGEKPFKCDTCGKAFRQKAHLLKHVQIHKRLPRD